MDESLAIPRATLERIAGVLTERRLTIAVAESLTGGLLAAHLTTLAGSSDFFAGGVIAYLDRVKIELLGVPADAIARESAVSQPVAAAMAAGVRAHLRTDLALATTGLAGPGDAGTGLPVGLTFIALATPAATTVRCYQFVGTRAEIRLAAVRAALEWLDEWLQVAL